MRKKETEVVGAFFEIDALLVIAKIIEMGSNERPPIGDVLKIISYIGPKITEEDREELREYLNTHAHKISGQKH